MSLKRKASFPSAVSMGMGTYPDPHVYINDVPRHLNSRTRKRFRDDRPDEQTIYGKQVSESKLSRTISDRDYRKYIKIAVCSTEATTNACE